MSRYRWEVYIDGDLMRGTVCAATPFGAGACAVLQWPKRALIAERNKKHIRVKAIAEIRDKRAD